MSRVEIQRACRQRYHERNRDRLNAERLARYRRSRVLCADCKGKSFAEWCHDCRSKRVVRRGEQGPDYVELATREIEQRVGRPYKQFTRQDHWSVTALLVEWAQSRGQLLDYSRTEMPKGAHRRHRGDAA